MESEKRGQLDTFLRWGAFQAPSGHYSDLAMGQADTEDTEGA